MMSAGNIWLIILLLSPCLFIQCVVTAPNPKESPEPQKLPDGNENLISSEKDDLKPKSSEPENLSTPLQLGLTKRDVEKEADSANGKTPLYLYKKAFYPPNTRRFLNFYSANLNKRAFPPFALKYQQRYRRSFQSEIPHGLDLYSRPRHPELDFQPESDQEKEQFLRLMALLAMKDENNNFDNFLPMKPEDDEGLFLEDEMPPIDLGYYGPPDVFPSSAVSKFHYDVDQGPEELTKMGIHLSEVPGPGGLYLTPPRKPNEFNDDWMEEPVPLQSHFKTRRSDDSLFRHNPVKSHFRRYLRSAGTYNEDYGLGGEFGSFYPQRESTLVRKRRSSKLPHKIAM